ncbi:hypothetical protein JCM8547_002585 [Rhodosporidiobolus lusitaniae]
MAVSQPGPLHSAQPLRPVLDGTWTRVDEVPPRASNGEAMLEGEDEDQWEEDEVEYVTLEFGQHLKEEVLANAGEMQLLALESKTPYVRVGDQFFVGSHEALIGTDILLHHDSTSNIPYKPVGTSSHRITFQPVSVQLAPEKDVPNLDLPQPPQGEDGHGDIPRVAGRRKGSKNKPKEEQPAPEEDGDEQGGEEQQEDGSPAPTSEAGAEAGSSQPTPPAGAQPDRMDED